MKKEHIAPFFETLRQANPHPKTELEYRTDFELLTAVLLSAQATWAADGQLFEIVEASPEFTDGLALMGASQLAAQSTVQDLTP